jgi:hypothetical protein
MHRTHQAKQENALKAMNVETGEKSEMMKKMNGSLTESPWDVWAVLIFAGVILIAIGFINNYYIEYAAFLRTSPEKLKAIETANAVRSCFLGGKAYVTKDFLQQFDGEDIDVLCGFHEPDTQVDVVDIETGQKWKFDSSVNNPDHSVWIPIAELNFDELKDVNYVFRGEYVINARWFGVGTLNFKANDVMLEIYPAELYPSGADDVEKVEPAKIREWIGKIDNEAMEDKRKSDMSGVILSAIIPDGYSLTECSHVGDTSTHEACVKIFREVKKMHLGRLNVDVEI